MSFRAQQARGRLSRDAASTELLQMFPCLPPFPSSPLLPIQSALPGLEIGLELPPSVLGRPCSRAPKLVQMGAAVVHQKENPVWLLFSFSQLSCFFLR